MRPDWVTGYGLGCERPGPRERCVFFTSATQRRVEALALDASASELHPRVPTQVRGHLDRRLGPGRGPRTGRNGRRRRQSVVYSTPPSASISSGPRRTRYCGLQRRPRTCTRRCASLPRQQPLQMIAVDGTSSTCRAQRYRCSCDTDDPGSTWTNASGCSPLARFVVHGAEDACRCRPARCSPSTASYARLRHRCARAALGRHRHCTPRWRGLMSDDAEQLKVIDGSHVFVNLRDRVEVFDFGTTTGCLNLI